ncbi:MAG: rhodanese-like domain-containing protein [Eubacteriales bacterium]
MKKRVGISAVLLLILIGLLVSGCGGPGTNKTTDSATVTTPTTGYQDITAGQLKSMRESDKNLLVVDVRENEEYGLGHISGSLLIPIGEVQSRVNELPRDKKIVVVCATGARSSQVADYLVQQGYTGVYNLSGGLASWPYELVK